MATSPSRCRYCQTDGLQWREVDGRWRLFYSDGKPHLCRATRDKIAKSIHREPIGPPTQEQYLIRYLTKEGVKMAMKKRPEPEIPPEDMHDPWWDFLFQDERKVGREAAAKQMELIP